MDPGVLSAIIIFGSILFFYSLRIINEYERGVVFTLGKYSYLFNPGLKILIPIIQRVVVIDTRVKTVDVPEQECITKDNISVTVNAVLYYRVEDPVKAVLEVENFSYAVSQLAQTTMRNVIGEVTLDELLANRDSVSARIRSIVDKQTDSWGINIEAVELKKIDLPESMIRTMAKAAEAERERRAVIIKAEGDVIAAKNLAKAAEILSSSPGALHLRTLQSINDLSSDQSNTVVFAVPVEVLKTIEGFDNFLNGKVSLKKVRKNDKK